MTIYIGNLSTLEAWMFIATFVATCNIMGFTYWFLYKKTGNALIALVQGVAFSMLFSMVALGIISATIN